MPKAHSDELIKLNKAKFFVPETFRQKSYQASLWQGYSSQEKKLFLILHERKKVNPLEAKM